jgi:hypothetical protein
MRRVGRNQYVCAVCEKQLDELTAKNLDPFCSTKCCHAYHGIEITMPGRGVLVASTV